MNILLISGSPRKGGNTEAMADAFAKGAREAGNMVTVKKMSELTVAPCIACEYCTSHAGICSQKDDMTDILKSACAADMLVFASPIYWFGLSAQTKAVIDRLYALVKGEYNVQHTALLLNAGSPGVFDLAIAEYKAIKSALNWEDKGVITVGGMSGKDSMKHSTQLEEVYALGKSLVGAEKK